MDKLKPPFPWFGGKTRVSDEVWSRFGNVKHYIEPFFGSGAVLLQRPHEPQVETVNDFDGLLANFWRAMTLDPDAVIHHADWPVNEADLHARHIWLLGQKESLTDRLMGDPDWFDPKAAGWWVWGICCWIGSGYCSGNGPWVSVDGVFMKRADAESEGVHRKLPSLGDGGRGVHRIVPDDGGVTRQLPSISTNGTGIHCVPPDGGVPRQIPRLAGNAGINRDHEDAQSGAEYWLRPIAERMKRVRVACGDWTRVLGPSLLRMGVTAVFLDPPYDDGAIDYASGGRGIAQDVREWCIEHESDENLRIALCGYEGDHDELEARGWKVFKWKAAGGYGVQGDGEGRENSARERIWFSPNCLDPEADKWDLGWIGG